MRSNKWQKLIIHLHKLFHSHENKKKKNPRADVHPRNFEEIIVPLFQQVHKIFNRKLPAEIYATFFFTKTQHIGVISTNRGFVYQRAVYSLSFDDRNAPTAREFSHIHSVWLLDARKHQAFKVEVTGLQFIQSHHVVANNERDNNESYKHCLNVFW